MNPLIPGVGDVLLASAVLVNVVLVVAALIILIRAADKRHWLWMVFLIVFVPLAGPIVALITLRRRAIAERSAPSGVGAIAT